MKPAIFIKELNRPVLVIDSVTQGSDIGQFGYNKNNILAGVLGALILRHCIHLSCIPNIKFSKQVDAELLLLALDRWAEKLAVNSDQALAVHFEDTLNYFLMFITNGYLVPPKAVIQ